MNTTPAISNPSDAELRARERYLTLLNEITRAAISALTFPEMLQTLADRLGELFDADGCFITLWDEVRQATVPAAAYGPLREAYPTLHPQPGEATMTESVLRAGHALVAEDAHNSPYISPRIAAQFPTRSVLGLPLIAGDQRLGAALIAFDQPRHFTPDDIARGEQAAAQIALAVARARLLESEREQRALAEALRDTAAALNSTLDFDEVLDRILANVGRVVPHDAASMMLVESGVARVARHRGYTDRAYEEWLLTLRFTVADVRSLREMAETGRPMAVPDTHAYPGWVTRPGAGWLRSYAGAPIRSKGQAIGFLNLDSATPGFFTTAHAERLQAFVDQAATAIENARLFEAERTARQQAEALRAATQALSATLDLRQVFERILSELQQVVPYDTASVQQLDGDQMKIIGGHGFSNLDELLGLTFDLTTGSNPNREVVRSRAPVIIDDAPVAYGDFYRQPHAAAGIRSWLGVPLLFGDRVIGMIALDKREPGFYTRQHAQLAMAFAAQAAIAVENARLFESEREQRALAEALRDTAATLTSTLDFDEVLERILTLVGRVTPHDAASIMLVDSGVASVARRVGYAEPGLESAVRSLRFSVAETPSLRSMSETGRPLTIPDTRADPGWVDTRETRWVGSYTSAPIRLKGQVIGFLNLNSAAPGFFTPAHAERLQAFADQAAVAIENARLYEAIRHHADELEQRVAERTAELERARTRMQAILDAAGEGIVLTDRDFVIRYINAATERLTGYTLAETLGRTTPWKSGLTPPAVYEDMRRTLDRGEVWRGEAINRRKDGTLYDATLTVNPLRSARGDIVGYVFVQRDISRQKELDRLKDQFVSNVSHELRTPLANVKLYVELLERGRPEKREQYMQTLHRETARLQKMIEDLLDLSRLDLGTAEIHAAPTDLNRIAADLITDRSAMATGRGVSLDYAPAADLPACLADPELIGQAMSNLITNAIAYTPQGGRVTLATEARHDDGRPWITFRVQDTGPGISANDRSHLFERFYRGEAGRKSGAPGTGLGLAICKGIVEKLDGRITFESQPGHGATFTVWLRPVHDPE